MEFEDIEDLQMATGTAVLEWEKYVAALKMDDPMLPLWPKAAKWALEEDFRLFAEFWIMEEADQEKGELFAISKMVSAWIIDRTTRCADRDPLERRASIIMGDEFFFGPDKIEEILNMEFPPSELAALKSFPSEAEMREKRGSHLMFYGCAMTDYDISLLISGHFMDPSVKDFAKKQMSHPKIALRSGWQFAEILEMEDAGHVDAAWPTVFAYMLFNLSRKSA